SAPIWTADAAALAATARALAAAPEVSLDTEGDSLHHYPERLSLVQLATPDGVWLVDPLALPDLTPLAPVFAEHSPVVVVRAGGSAGWRRSARRSPRRSCRSASSTPTRTSASRALASCHRGGSPSCASCGRCASRWHARRTVRRSRSCRRRFSWRSHARRRG